VDEGALGASSRRDIPLSRRGTDRASDKGLSLIAFDSSDGAAQPMTLACASNADGCIVRGAPLESPSRQHTVVPQRDRSGGLSRIEVR
jgi:hypothetical protein